MQNESILNINALPYNKTFAILQQLHLVTKTLKFQAIKKGELARKLVVSTQFLAQMNYQKGDRLIEKPIGKGQGLRIRKAQFGESNDKIVYQRSYKRSSRTENMLVYGDIIV